MEAPSVFEPSRLRSCRSSRVRPCRGPHSGEPLLGYEPPSPPADIRDPFSKSAWPPAPPPGPRARRLRQCHRWLAPSGRLRCNRASCLHRIEPDFDVARLLSRLLRSLWTKDLIRYAEELTLDVDVFRDEVKNETHSERVRADFLAGVQNGVYGTPGLFLNGVRYDGEWDKESLESHLI